MSVKIMSQVKGYQPVTIELTFDTLQQLECFYTLYEDPGKTAANMFDYNEELADSIDDTIDMRTLEQLGAIIDRCKP